MPVAQSKAWHVDPRYDGLFRSHSFAALNVDTKLRLI